MRTIEDIIKLVCGYLNTQEIPYVIVGGVSLPFFGTPRTTVDIDLIISINLKDVSKLEDFLRENDFWIPKGDLESALKERSHSTPLDEKSPYRLDIQGTYNELNELTLKRRKQIEYAGTKIFIASPEEAILGKLIFGSPQDMRDVKGILIRQYGKLDIDYLERMAKKFGVYKDYVKLKQRIEKKMKEGM